MVSVARVMGEVRSVLARPYGATSWQALCEALAPSLELERERWRAELEPYVARGIAAWPEAVRVAPMAWVMGATSGQGGALRLARVVRLDPQGAEVLWGDDALAALVESPDFGQIVCLDAAGGGFGDQAALAIARSPHAALLRELSLARCEVTSQGARFLARSNSLPSLRVLDLSGNDGIGPAGCAAFWDAPQSKRLHALRLQGCRWDGDVFWEVYRPSTLSAVDVDVADALTARWQDWWYDHDYM
jgi:hypothetical protein